MPDTRADCLADSDTIAAIATPSGQGGVGIIRISGPEVPHISQEILGLLPAPRYAHYGPFHGPEKQILDYGLGLYFPAPNSFTGEHVLELQGHGGPVLLDMLLSHCLSLGARLARPGEFSERAFLNGKLDLAQAEAVADLIAASTTVAAKSALSSLKGEFSQRIENLNEQIVAIRMFIESAIDFPDEEIEFLASGQIHKKLDALTIELNHLLASANLGVRLREGLKVALVGEPNVGKSSLLNALCGEAVAIVSSQPGTTRDLVKEHIHIEGVPLEIIDTAGMRNAGDAVEEEGMRRAQAKLDDVDVILWVREHEAEQAPERLSELLSAQKEKVLSIINKIDQTQQVPGHHGTHLYLSAKSGAGIDTLRAYLKQAIGGQQSPEGCFIARRRHVVAIEQADSHIRAALNNLDHQGSECAAEELRLAHQSLCEITGAFTADDLLGKIFSEFCIGK